MQINIKIMNDQTILLGEKENKILVRIVVFIFGLLCIFTAGWWTVFLIKYPDNEKIFWAGSIFLFLFGIYQIYSGLGYAKRYLKKEGENIIIRQNSLLPAKKIRRDHITYLEIRPFDMVIHLNNSKRIRIKPGLKYPVQGQRIMGFLSEYAEINKIKIIYKNESL